MITLESLSEVIIDMHKENKELKAELKRLNEKLLNLQTALKLNLKGDESQVEGLPPYKEQVKP